jgi:hypothetical protein
MRGGIGLAPTGLPRRTEAIQSLRQASQWDLCSSTHFAASMGHDHHCAQQHMPSELVQLYYSSLNEKSQLKAIRTIFDTYEKEPAALEFIASLIAYFNWCSDARNTLLHSEFYPTLFGGDADKLYLIKPQSKREPTSSYMWFTVEELRDIADKIEHGKRECAGLLIYLRCRDIPADQLPVAYRAYLDVVMPAPLVTPPELKLSPHPEHGAMPDHLQDRKR